jgi:hypothetical protein
MVSSIPESQPSHPDCPREVAPATTIATGTGLAAMLALPSRVRSAVAAS